VAKAKRGYHAELDALEIWIHVARHDLAAADRLIDRFTETINLLAEPSAFGPHGRLSLAGASLDAGR